MARIAVVYGSTTGNTQQAAEKIQSALGDADLMSADRHALSLLAGYDVVLMGSSTWGYGDLQDDWESVSGDLGTLNLKGKKVGFFGTGDQASYDDTFVDAMGILYEFLSGTGADFIGAWPAEGYSFSESKAVKGGAFVGLALDEDNQADLSDDRISDWVKKVLEEI